MSLTLDIRYAARLLIKRPAFTGLMIAIVAVGLGLTLYTYSLLNGLLFKPLAFADNESVYAVEAMYDHTHLARRPANSYDLYQLQQDKTLFKEMGFYSEGTTFVGGAGERLRKFNSSYVSWNVFSFAGVKPLMGRALLPEDHYEGAEQVVVLGYEMWQGYFNGDEDLIGTLVPIDGADPARIVGIMPEGFLFPSVAQMWQPLEQRNITPTERGNNFSFAFAKLADGISLDKAKHILNNKSADIILNLPDRMRWMTNDDNQYLSIEPFKKANLTQYYGMFIALFIVVFLILLLACINVGNLFKVAKSEIAGSPFT